MYLCNANINTFTQMKPKLISIDQAAELTNMSPSWWRAAVQGRKPLPPVRVVRIGGAIRLHLGDLLAFIDGESSESSPSATKRKRKRGRPQKKPPQNGNVAK